MRATETETETRAHARGGVCTTHKTHDARFLKPSRRGQVLYINRVAPAAQVAIQSERWEGVVLTL